MMHAGRESRSVADEASSEAAQASTKLDTLRTKMAAAAVLQAHRCKGVSIIALAAKTAALAAEAADKLYTAERATAAQLVASDAARNRAAACRDNAKDLAAQGRHEEAGDAQLAADEAEHNDSTDTAAAAQRQQAVCEIEAAAAQGHADAARRELDTWARTMTALTRAHDSADAARLKRAAATSLQKIAATARAVAARHDAAAGAAEDRARVLRRAVAQLKASGVADGVSEAHDAAVKSGKHAATCREEAARAAAAADTKRLAAERAEASAVEAEAVATTQQRDLEQLMASAAAICLVRQLNSEHAAIVSHHVANRANEEHMAAQADSDQAAAATLQVVFRDLAAAAEAAEAQAAVAEDGLTAAEKVRGLRKRLHAVKCFQLSSRNLTTLVRCRTQTAQGERHWNGSSPLRSTLLCAPLLR